MDTFAASEIKILGSGLDTVILNIYLTDVEETIIHQPLPDALQEELNLDKERAHADEVEISSYFASFKLKSVLALVPRHRVVGKNSPVLLLAHAIRGLL
jgi:hypothetical protein